MTDKPVPLMDRDPFTDEDRERMRELMIDEVKDNPSQAAHSILQSMTDYLDLVSYADPDPGLTTDVMQALQENSCDYADLVCGEHEGHREAAKFLLRMKLMRPDTSELTDYGVTYLETYK